MNDEMEDIIKVVKSLEVFCLLVEVATETVQNEVKEQKAGFLSMLLCTSGASLLGNLLTRKRIPTAGTGNGLNGAGEGIVRVGHGSTMDF